MTLVIQVFVYLAPGPRTCRGGVDAVPGRTRRGRGVLDRGPRLALRSEPLRAPRAPSARCRLGAQCARDARFSLAPALNSTMVGRNVGCCRAQPPAGAPRCRVWPAAPVAPAHAPPRQRRRDLAAGPHQGAQKSTSTGIWAALPCLAKLAASSASGAPANNPLAATGHRASAQLRGLHAVGGAATGRDDAQGFMGGAFRTVLLDISHRLRNSTCGDRSQPLTARLQHKAEQHRAGQNEPPRPNSRNRKSPGSRPSPRRCSHGDRPLIKTSTRKTTMSQRIMATAGAYGRPAQSPGRP